MKIKGFLLFILIFIPIYGVIGTIWGISKQNIYAMVSGIACLALSFIFLLILIWRIANKNKKQKAILKSQFNNVCAKIEQEQKDKKEKHKNFEENSTFIVNKYAQSVRNYIEKMVNEIGCPFLGMFVDREIPLSSILIYPYRNSSSQLLRDEIKRDGLEFIQSTNEEQCNKLQNITEFFIAGLKKRIIDNNEWQDDFTLPVLLYLIVRNNVIKYYHDKYLEDYGFESLEEFCINSNNATIKIATMHFVYFYIYEHDISLPFIDTYTKICVEIDKIYDGLKAQKLENDLFGSPRKKSDFIEKSLDKNKPSTIDRIDNMSGEEFELFITQFFIKQGYKTTHTPLSGDYGIDLIVENDFGKIGVQAKRYKNKVSLDAVQQVVAGLRYYALSSGLVITNNYFQPSAIKLAAANNVTLWNRDKLIEKLGK